MKILLANLTLKNPNRGCQALCLSTMYLLDKILTEKGIPYEFYLTDSGYSKNEQRVLEVGVKSITYFSCGYYNLLDLKSSVKSIVKSLINRKEFKENKQIFKNADFVFDIGQGDSFADIYGKSRFDNIDKIHKIAQKYRIPYCILPQTIGPFKDEMIKRSAFNSIDQATVVMARDYQSLKYVKDNLPNKAIEEYIDVAFFMPFTKHYFDDNFIHVGLNISGLLWHGGYTQNNQFGLKGNYTKLIKDIINMFLSNDNVKLHLIGHVVSSEREVENDYAVNYDLFNEIGSSNLILAPLFLSAIDAKGYIAGMDFFAGARMHAAIAAFSSGVPVFPMAYSRKFNGLFKDTLSYEVMGDLLVDDYDNLLHYLNDAFKRREELKLIIENRLNTVVKEKGRLLEQSIVDFLNIGQTYEKSR